MAPASYWVIIAFFSGALPFSVWIGRLALKADPTHQSAAKALGYVLKDGKWGPKEDIVIEPARPPQRDEYEEIKRLTQQLKALEKPDVEGDPVSKALLSLVQERPELFIRVSRPPRSAGSANVEDPVIRARAMAWLGLAGDRKAMQPLLDSCFYDADVGARHAAARALAQLDEPIAMRKLVDFAIDPRQGWPVRKLAVAALRSYDDKEAVTRLLGELSFELAAGQARDPDNPLRMASPKTSLPEDPIKIVEAQPPPERDPTRLYPVLTALKELTGQSFKNGEKFYKTWKDWWDKEKNKFEFP
jgi:hypothetical protein